MTDSYPQKYWWVVLVLVPLALALLALLPDLFRGSGGNGGHGSAGNSIAIEGSRIDGDVQIVGSQVIYNQLAARAGENGPEDSQQATLERAFNLLEAGLYQQAEPLFQQLADTLETPESYNNLGAVRLLAGNPEGAEQALVEGLARAPRTTELRRNYAQLAAEEGRVDEALHQLEGISEDPAARRQLASLGTAIEGGTLEIEDNNDILSANAISLSSAVRGSIEARGDVDFFRFRSPPPPRDRYTVTLDNQSTRLAPHLSLWHPDKSLLGATYHAPTPGQDARFDLTAGPDSEYFVSVASTGEGGDYTLTVSPLGAFDRYEPNDRILEAATITAGTPVVANTMDGADRDYYRIALAAGSVSFRLHNESATLRPRLQFFNPGKKLLWETYHNPTSGQDVSQDADITEAGDYYIAVLPVSASAGAYRLEAVAR